MFAAALFLLWVHPSSILFNVAATLLANMMSPERDAAAWLTLCVVLCLLAPGGPVQHLIHHRPWWSGPGLALHGGWGHHVHSGVCRMHWSAARKHLPAQVCMFHDKNNVTICTHRWIMAKCNSANPNVNLSSFLFPCSSCRSSPCFLESSFSWSLRPESWRLSLRTGLKTSSTCSSTITSERTGTTSIFRTSSISHRNT